MHGPATLHIKLYRGDNFDLTIRFTAADGTALDMTARTFAAQYRETFDAPTAASFSVDSTEAATGEISVHLSSTQTAAIRHDGVWDFQETRAGMLIRTWVAGRANLVKDVTRP